MRPLTKYNRLHHSNTIAHYIIFRHNNDWAKRGIILVFIVACICIINICIEFDEYHNKFTVVRSQRYLQNATITTKPKTMNESIIIINIHNKKESNAKDVINDSSGNKCIVWYPKFLHFEIMPSIIETFLNLNQNITNFYVMLPSLDAPDAILRLNDFYQNHIYKQDFKLYCILLRHAALFPNHNLLSNLNSNDIVVATTVYWGIRAMERVWTVMDIKNKYSLKFKYLLLFHMPILEDVAVTQHQLKSHYECFLNGTIYALCLTPTFRLVQPKMIPLIPTYTYRSVNANPNTNYKFTCAKKEKAQKYIIIIQGGNQKKRDRSLLLQILKHDRFQEKLQRYFLFQWYGFIAIDDSDSLDRELFSGKYNQSLQVFADLNDIDFTYGVSFGDIYFTMLSKNTIGKYSEGHKFTSTLVYSFAMEKPVLIYDEITNKWSQTFGNVTSFLSYHDVDDIVNILSHVVESDTYYDHCCQSARQMAQLIRQENYKNLQVLFKGVQ